MSKVKTPQEKKRLSLKRDRRNCYGENSKASRKAIPLRKKIQHKKDRLEAKRVLESIEPGDDDEGLLRTKKKAEFVKVPDEPLGETLARKDKNRQERSFRKA
jgi:hypothetical protein